MLTNVLLCDGKFIFSLSLSSTLSLSKSRRVCPRWMFRSPRNNNISARNRRPTLASLQLCAKESVVPVVVVVAAAVVVVDSTVVAAQSSLVAWRIVVAGTTAVAAAIDLRHRRPSSSFHRRPSFVVERGR